MNLSLRRLAIVALLPGLALAQPIRVLPDDAVADYQLGGSYPPPPGVNVVVRDSTATPAAGRYNVCYVNGFQTQPGEVWPADLLVAGPAGTPLADAGWPDEFLLNIADEARRGRVAARLESSIARCARAGFDAVEFDNLDSYTRSQGVLSAADALSFARQLVALAHAHGLAAGQKNAPDLGRAGKDRAGFDFVVSEECDRYHECAAYTAVYGRQTINIEYHDALRRPFREICADGQTPPDTVLRDRLLSPPGSADYRFRHCRTLTAPRH